MHLGSDIPLAIAAARSSRRGCPSGGGLIVPLDTTFCPGGVDAQRLEGAVVLPRRRIQAQRSRLHHTARWYSGRQGEFYQGAEVIVRLGLHLEDRV